MGRKPTISNDAIVHGAREVFLEAGPGAPTSRIAEACGVSEGTLFKRFGTKESLCRRDGTPATGTRDWGHSDGSSGGNSPEALHSHRRTARPIFCPGHSENDDHVRLGKPAARKDFRKRPEAPLELLRAVEKMFNSEIQEGRIALDDPEVAARMMLSTSHNLAFFETMGIEPTRTSEEQLEYMARMVNLLRFNEDQKENVCK